ncbi:chorismate synthase [Treponema sp. C6A8]|uniref:chorismate synthase n=1 Tax=Treponema sp. C6A8 TaxID=1410609 RepID=UPI000488F6BB|nr:chorismate synthase [Treponema sp. C6A8]
MSGNSFGSVFRVTTFGESHGAALGCVIDGCPAGVKIDRDFIQAALNRRRPGAWGEQGLNASVTARKEADEVEILSGLFEGRSTGTPISLLIRNTSQHSKDYSNIAASYRPGHADFTYDAKYGFRDYRGGGRSSGRETAARVAAGAVAACLTSLSGIKVTAYTIEAAGIKAEKRDLSQIEKNPLRAPDGDSALKMNEAIEKLRSEGDSAGGIIECLVEGCPAGLGEPVFDKLDALLAHAMLSIGAVKGIEFGDGFEAARSTGSTNNDAMHAENGAPVFDTNHAGGILGGISNGNKIIFRVAVKPVPSIFKPQNTVRHEGDSLVSSQLQIQGRHDVCLCPRIVPVIEAMAQLVLADLLLQNRSSKVDF